MINGAWIMAHGESSAMSIHSRTFLLSSSASMKRNQPRFHFDLGPATCDSARGGCLLVGSGNVVHNLHAYAWGRHAQEPYDWTVSFESRLRELLLAEQYIPLIDYESKLGSEADLAVPRPTTICPCSMWRHSRESESLTFPVEGVDGGSVSMLAGPGRLTGAKRRSSFLKGEDRMFKRIAVAFDESPEAGRAFRSALDLAKRSARTFTSLRLWKICPHTSAISPQWRPMCRKC